MLRTVTTALLAATLAGACATAPLDRSEFPLSDVAPSAHPDIDVEAIRRQAAAVPVDRGEMAEVLARHAEFLERFGGGGRWQVFTVSGLVLGIYVGDGATAELQATLMMRSFAADVPTRGLALPWGNLCGSTLAHRDLQGADLAGSLLTDSDLRAADLRSANLAGADLSRADLRSADLRDADLRGVDFEDADLRGADLRGAALDGGRYPGARLKGLRR